MSHYRHYDFQRIYDEFVSYYKDPLRGKNEYYDWLKALSLNESNPYGEAREEFKWAANMIRLLKEDAENKFYGILVALPLRSMNGNVYRERDLIAAALSLKGKHPSVNHKDEYWLSPSNPRNRWGTATVVDAKYEDGAVEAILKVPKTAGCPVCPKPNSKLTELIDGKYIVNVSLEGKNTGAFEFTDPPFTLLTVDTLPGIPLARIKPLEHIMVEALQTSIRRNEKMKIKATIKENTQLNTHNTPPLPDARDQTRGTWGGEVSSDAALHTPTDNAEVALGTSPVDKTFQSGSPMTDKMVGSNTECSCPEGEHKENGQCVPNTESQEYSSAPQRGIDSHIGPDRTKAPSRSIPEKGGLPSSKDTAVVTGTSPAADGVWTGSSPVEALNAEVKAIKAETKAAIAQSENAKLREDMEKVEVIWASKYATIAEELRREKAYNQSQDAILKEQREAFRNEQLRCEDLRVEARDVKNQMADLVSVNNKQSHLIEDLKIENAALNQKYSSSLRDNLTLSKELTKEKEDYLELSKQKDHVEEKLQRARIEAKKTLKITA